MCGRPQPALRRPRTTLSLLVVPVGACPPTDQGSSPQVLLRASYPHLGSSGFCISSGPRSRTLQLPTCTAQTWTSEICLRRGGSTDLHHVFALVPVFDVPDPDLSNQHCHMNHRSGWRRFRATQQREKEGNPGPCWPLLHAWFVRGRRDRCLGVDVEAKGRGGGGGRCDGSIGRVVRSQASWQNSNASVLDGAGKEQVMSAVRSRIGRRGGKREEGGRRVRRRMRPPGAGRM